MYTAFYNLKEQPFNLTPSPRFLYLGEVHKEALAVLTYGVVEQKGFILLTGEVGTGKSTMVQALLANLSKDVEYVYISNPLFSPKDFMNYLASKAFKKKLNVKSKAQFLMEFEGFLKGRLQHQKNFLLIIDEAQKLSFELLEEIRLLSNMEIGDRKLINIFLVGQPELNEKLSQPKCRPLLQRISIRYHIKPLDLEGAQEYIETALKTAGAENAYKIFPKNVVKAIHQYSNGYPRMINILADNLLLLGYSRGKTKITPLMVKECYDDLQLDSSPLRTSPQESERPEVVKAQPLLQVRRHWKWAAVLFLVMVFLAVVMSEQGKNIFSRLTGSVPVSSQSTPDNSAGKQISMRKKIVQKIQDVPRQDSDNGADNSEP